ncbi:MAG: hypothetical protein AAGI14_04560 [Pseudomonadota bacterium]
MKLICVLSGPCIFEDQEAFFVILLFIVLTHDTVTAKKLGGFGIPAIRCDESAGKVVALIANGH